MGKKQRKHKRFQELGKVAVPELCIFSGLLLDISLAGCCIRFPAVVEPDLNCDYEASFSFSNKQVPSSCTLIVHPCWTRYENGTTEIGFEFLHSPGTKALVSHIDYLAGENTVNAEAQYSYV